MNKKIKIEIAVGVIILLAIILGISFWYGTQYVSAPEKSPNPIQSQAPIENKTSLANPASVYCEQNGGKLEIRTDQNGGQIGYCKFASGKGCEEWAFMRGECKADYQYANTDKWNTYQNKKYGFEFKYPWDWDNVGSNFSMKGTQIGVLQVEIIDKNISLAKFVEDEIKQNNCGESDHVIKEINGGILYVLYCSATSENYVYLKAEGAKIIKLNYHDNFGDCLEAECIQTFEKIISTLKFESKNVAKMTHEICEAEGAMWFCGDQDVDPGIEPKFECVCDCGNGINILENTTQSCK